MDAISDYVSLRDRQEDELKSLIRAQQRRIAALERRLTESWPAPYRPHGAGDCLPGGGAGHNEERRK